MNYIKNNVHRMDYPKYQANGWHIGSGPVESACKTVVNRWLCGGGMRWRERGTDAICHLRAFYRSETSQWSAFWNPAVVQTNVVINLPTMKKPTLGLLTQAM